MYLGAYIFWGILMIGSFIFAGLQVEELITGCYLNQISVMQLLNLSMDFSDCDSDKFMKNTYIELVATLAYGFTMMFISSETLKEYHKRQKVRKQ